MDNNLIIEGEDFRLEIESEDFEFIAAVQAFVADLIADYEYEEVDEEEYFDFEDEEESEEE
jgi:hypothetical protein